MPRPAQGQVEPVEPWSRADEGIPIGRVVVGAGESAGPFRPRIRRHPCAEAGSNCRFVLGAELTRTVVAALVSHLRLVRDHPGESGSIGPHHDVGSHVGERDLHLRPVRRLAHERDLEASQRDRQLEGCGLCELTPPASGGKNDGSSVNRPGVRVDAVRPTSVDEDPRDRTSDRRPHAGLNACRKPPSVILYLSANPPSGSRHRRMPSSESNGSSAVISSRSTTLVLQPPAAKPGHVVAQRLDAIRGCCEQVAGSHVARVSGAHFLGPVLDDLDATHREAGDGSFE